MNREVEPPMARLTGTFGRIFVWASIIGYCGWIAVPLTDAIYYGELGEFLGTLTCPVFSDQC
jgi:hypothetical protein